MTTRKSPSGETGAIPKSIAADHSNHTVDPRQIAWDNAASWWKSSADQAMKALVDSGQPFTIDEFSQLVPKPDHPTRTGAVVARRYRREKIQVVGACLSAEDGRPLRIWQAVGGGQT